MLCIAERTKKGTLKPCIKTIPFSTITGALKNKFNRPDIYAVGKLNANYLENIEDFRAIHIYSPRHLFQDVAKVPLRIEFLTGVNAHVYVFLKEGGEERFIDETNKDFDIFLGAFKSKGFGKCHLKFARLIADYEIKLGELQTRIPEIYLDYFEVSDVIKPIYGYLFEPLDKVSGKYVRAIFEGSKVKAPRFLVKEGCDERS
jgi:hypothetical protein